MNDKDGRDDKRQRDGRRPGQGAGRQGAGGDKKPFKPRSHGMKSHGGHDADGAPKKPRSYGRLSHEAGGRDDDRRGGFGKDGEKRGGFGKPRAFAERADAPHTARPPRDAAPEDVGTMRIAKRLARAGVASRRDAEGMIADGRVRVNGTLLDSPAVDVGPSDRIEVDGAPLPAIERTRLWLFHKPAGLVTTNRDPEGRPTVFDRLPEDMPRVLSIGRLDINTEGLLLLTNDGGLSRTLELPATGWLRRYRVRVHGSVSQAALDELRQGIAIDGVFYGAVEATLDREQGSNAWLTVGLREGKNREVKRILGHLGLEVNRLIRVSFGPFQLGELAEGAVMEVKGRTLRDQLGARLIEESGANFDAPIVNEFSNKPVRTEKRDAPERRRADGADGEWITVGDMKRKPNRKRSDAAFRENGLARLDTRPGGDRGPRRERDDKPFREGRPDRRERRDGDGEEAPRPRRPAPSTGRRSANVWMAPGARAIGPKRKEALEEGARAEGSRPPRSGRPDQKGPRGDGPKGDGPKRSGQRPGGPKGSGPRPGRPGPSRGR
ncbi:pseudouridine synthase [Aureimonas altamirensis]|uniref:pseudouridine synthase n=1 Tax=Aureimonas altamirensis TaxID=370622 RepID=UPI0020372407|nr:pseudouridine synthase [Aureimonas altamirensis]MCM2503484.1 pseudouridine synthase [Aureimonas altamirensis]